MSRAAWICVWHRRICNRALEVFLRKDVSDLVWSCAPQWVSRDEVSCLVHGDFGSRNLLLHQTAGKWEVAAVLDWEFAVSASPLIDVGHVLRYERVSRPIEPHFSEAYVQAGGSLCQGWRRLARVLDMIALCESLTHEELPEPVLVERIELVCATVEDRDPQP